MSSNSNLSPKNKIQMKKSKLSSTVLDYYHKYGQNRDLEKYLRLRRQNSSKSSSDGSLQYAERISAANDTERVVKSLEKLSLANESKSSTEKDKTKRETKSSENVCVVSDEPKKDFPAGAKSIKIEKNSQQNMGTKSKSKSYNFNLESSIEINLPPSYSMPLLPNLSKDSEPIKNAPAKLLFETSETQTESIVPHQSESNSSKLPNEGRLSLVNAEPLLGEDERLQKSIPEIVVQESSPASSVASTKVRLEWDSMADVGYNRIIDFKSQSNSNLTSFEKNALTKFFAKRGLNFDDSLVIIASPDAQNDFRKKKLAKSALELRSEKEENSWKPLAKDDLKNAPIKAKKLSPGTSKQLWEKALAKYRQKYGKTKCSPSELIANTVDSLHFMHLSMAPCHSTPVAETPSKRSDVDVATNVVENNKSLSTELKCIERSCQVSGVEKREIQVDRAKDQVSKFVQVLEVENIMASSDDREITSVTSFEFMTPNAYKNEIIGVEKLPILDKTTVKTPEDRENVNSPHHGQAENKNLDAQEDDHQDDKENVPPIEDKENIPPPPQHSTNLFRNAPVERHGTNGIVQSNTAKDETIMPEQKCTMSDESILPNDLQKGIDLMHALVDSRKISNSAKKKLIRKIVRSMLKKKDLTNITQMLMSYSQSKKSIARNSHDPIDTSISIEKTDESSKTICSTSKQSISGVAALSSASDASSSKGKRNLANISDGIANAEEILSTKTEEVKEWEWLKPLTRSEIEWENARKARLLEQQKEINSNLVEHSTQTLSKHSSTKSQIKAVDIQECLENEKKTHFNWIDQEIEHLTKLKLRLKSIKISDTGSGNETTKTSSRTNNSTKGDSAAIYENLQRIRKNQLLPQVDTSTTPRESSTSASNKSEEFSKPSLTNKSRWIHKTTLESSQPSLSLSDTITRRRSKEHKTDHQKSDNLSEWDSHMNMQQLVKNRTKLQTPSSTDQSIESYAKERCVEFKKKYAKAQQSLSANTNSKSNAKSIQQPPIYTKPYSSDSYSDVERIKTKRIKQKANTISADAYASITGSDAFLSSNSISIGVAANSTSNTTTHQYDTKITVGIQTSDTLRRMQPIQLVKSVETKEIQTDKKQPVATVRVSKLTVNKQLQVRPEPIAYVITFRNQMKTDFDKNANTTSIGKERGNRYYENSSSNSSRICNMVCNDGKMNQQNVKPKKKTSDSTDSSTGSIGNFTLQEYLRARRPDFYSNAEQRRKYVNDLHDLRQQRNEQRKKLFAMNTCTNSNTLKANMKRLLPPPPLAQIRLFTSKDIVTRTRCNYRKLPEIRHRQRMERESKIRTNHRMLATIFNKNLQRRVLTGRTDLSNSICMTVN